MLGICVEFENLFKFLNIIIAFEWNAFACVNVIRSFFRSHAGLDRSKSRLYIILYNISTLNHAFYFIWTSNYNDAVFSILHSKTLLDMGLNTVDEWDHCTQLPYLPVYKSTFFDQKST